MEVGHTLMRQRNTTLLATFVLMLILMLTLLATYVLTGCSTTETAEARCGSRLSVEYVGCDDSGHATFFVVTDPETSRQWLYVRDTTYGNTSVDIEPLCEMVASDNEG